MLFRGESKLPLGSYVRPNPNEGWKKEKMIKRGPKELRTLKSQMPHTKTWRYMAPHPSKNTNHRIHHSSNECLKASAILSALQYWKLKSLRTLL